VPRTQVAERDVAEDRPKIAFKLLPECALAAEGQIGVKLVER
jgi:hypothetical protein